MEFLYEYGLFFAKTITFILAVIVLVIGVIAVSSGDSGDKNGQLKIEDISESILSLKEEVTSFLLSKNELKALKKAQKKSANASEDKKTRPKLFVLNFTGSVDAKETENLRKEVTALMSVATP